MAPLAYFFGEAWGHFCMAAARSKWPPACASSVIDVRSEWLCCKLVRLLMFTGAPLAGLLTELTEVFWGLIRLAEAEACKAARLGTGWA